jgi:LAO/AO transport system kinase
VLSLAASDRRPPVLLTDALTGQGVDELWDALAAHRRRLAESGELGERRARNLTREVFAIASARARTRLERAAREDPELARLLEAVARRELDPLSAVQAMVESVFRLSDGDEDGTGSR